MSSLAIGRHRRFEDNVTTLYFVIVGTPVACCYCPQRAPHSQNAVSRAADDNGITIICKLVLLASSA